jgi:hypothetical protein
MLILIQHVSVIEVNFDIEHMLQFQYVSLIDVNLNIEHVKFK